MYVRTYVCMFVRTYISIYNRGAISQARGVATTNPPGGGTAQKVTFRGDQFRVPPPGAFEGIEGPFWSVF